MAMTQTQLLQELEPVVAGELDRHNGVAKEWFPHEYVSVERGPRLRRRLRRRGLEGEPLQAARAARVSLIVNLLTEDNLPSYHPEITPTFGRDGAWGTWVDRWTAEEGRHGIAIRDYLRHRAVDPVALERARMDAHQCGYDPRTPTMLEGMAYVPSRSWRPGSPTATRASLRRPALRELMARVAADENLHNLFYRDPRRRRSSSPPNQPVRAVIEVVTEFLMPGTSIDDFASKRGDLAKAGIYDLLMLHDQVVAPVLRYWGVFEKLEGLGEEGERAREELSAYLERADATAARFVARREERKARAMK